jgi:putative tributyrin esterase
MRKSIIITLTLLLSVSIHAQELIVMKSYNLKCNDSILVFTPKECSSKQIPTLFLLHGWSGSFKDWNNKYDIQQISNKFGFRIICPDGFYNGWYLNNIDPNKMQWRGFFEEELYPEMVKRYGLIEDYTFITGLSMGGHGAINLFLDHPEWFRSAGSMSGVLNLRHTSLKEKHLSLVLGEYSSTNKRYDEESAVNRLNSYKSKYSKYQEKPLVITCGYDDVYAICTTEFSEKCKDENIPHFLMLSKGKHSWKYWGFALEMHLTLFKSILNGENIGY